MCKGLFWLLCKVRGLEMIFYSPGTRHPERTTAKRAGEKDPVRHVSRSDSAYKYIKQISETTGHLNDGKQDDWGHVKQSRFAVVRSG